MSGPPGEAIRVPSTGKSLSGIRAGLLVLITSLVGHAGNFLFYVVASRQLTPADFAEVAAVTAMGLIVFTPVNGVAAAAARDIAQKIAVDDPAAARAIVAWLVRRLLVVQAVLFGVGAALTPLATDVVGLSNPVTWLLAVLWLSLGLTLYAMLGPLQGYGRFGYVGALLAGPLGLLRVVFLVPLGAALGVPGAATALVVATVIGLVIAWLGLRRALSVSSALPAPVGSGLRDLSIAVLALFGFASLTNVDVILANSLLTGAQAATYASAALLGKIALYGPAALSMVLLPNVAARISQGQGIGRPVLLTQAAVIGSGLVTSLVFLLASRSLVGAVFGPDYAAAYPLLFPLSLVMTAAAVMNVNVTIAIARNDKRLIVGLLGLAVAHVGLLLLLGDSPGGLIVASAIAMGSALVIHEVVSQDGIVRLLVRMINERRATGDTVPTGDPGTAV